MSNLPDRRPAAPRQRLDARQARALLLAGVAVLVVSVALVFVVENSEEVHVSFVFFSADISLIWVIVLSAVLGAAAGAALGRLFRRRIGGR